MFLIMSSSLTAVFRKDYLKEFYDLVSNAITGHATEKTSTVLLPGLPEYVVNRLDESQKLSVQITCSSNRLTYIQGPPGTGKSTTSCQIALLKLMGNHKSRMVMSAVQNTAADVWALKFFNEVMSCPGLKEGKPNTAFGPDSIGVLRLRSSANTEENLMSGSLLDCDFLVLVDLVAHIVGKFLDHKILNRLKGVSTLKYLGNKIRGKRTKKVLSALQAIAVEHSNCVVTTVANAVRLPPVFKDLIVDECSQLSIYYLVILLNLLSPVKAEENLYPSVVLIGDENQLPPTGHSAVFQQSILDAFSGTTTLHPGFPLKFSKEHGNTEAVVSSSCMGVKSMLCVSYRLSKQVCLALSSYYRGLLVSSKRFMDFDETLQIIWVIVDHEPVKGPCPDWLKHRYRAYYTGSDINLMFSEYEGVAAQLITDLAPTTHFISLYKDNVLYLQNLFKALGRPTKAATVDSSQGAEFVDVAYASGTRGRFSNFNNKLERLIVALSRAKRSLFILGPQPPDHESILSNFWKFATKIPLVEFASGRSTAILSNIRNLNVEVKQKNSSSTVSCDAISYSAVNTNTVLGNWSAAVVNAYKSLPTAQLSRVFITPLGQRMLKTLLPSEYKGGHTVPILPSSLNLSVSSSISSNGNVFS